jgi:hypothetical protein
MHIISHNKSSHHISQYNIYVDLFGGKMALHNNRLIVTAMGATFKSGKKSFGSAGTAYVYERPEGTLFW